MNRKVEITVGLFMVIVICSVLFLCFRVTDASTFSNNSTYRIYAVFDNIGGLKTRSPVKIGGVVIGRVTNISLDSSDHSYKPYVTIDIDAKYNTIPSSSALSIKTSGLLGEQFVDVGLGIDNGTISEIDELDALESGLTAKDSAKQAPLYFQDGLVIHNTKPALVIEDLIGQFLYSSSNKDQANHTKD
ncbi:phospholipid/cholesterol/gamma-HCH transport system substrate-binding protein [Orbus hercynius]|uniref:Phospholipid/cholesterol/gamma-HCH transport system substrate-binding protein n=1 Tax=Orbus hercynius TaxID=593135 RepID=A0A495RB43_9GAMM|nr:outer membrane lipid asymmetry maintenance protein MlaD [Orbus hercynius]RKS84702.1 phospholipid/cholesterol/gamma-HCH transport system substrate-binding protein [Orbus hercynius]